jgi:hypothetical protein
MFDFLSGGLEDPELQKHKNSNKKENRFMRDISCMPHTILNSYVGLNGAIDMKDT